MAYLEFMASVPHNAVNATINSETASLPTPRVCLGSCCLATNDHHLQDAIILNPINLLEIGLRQNGKCLVGLLEKATPGRKSDWGVSTFPCGGSILCVFIFFTVKQSNLSGGQQ